MFFIRFSIKKISITFLFSIFVFSFLQAQDRSDYALLWEIQHKGDTKKSYLFGTMHLKDKRVFDFSDAFLPALKASEVFALELNPETLEMDLEKIKLFKDLSSKYKEILDSDDYERLRQKIKDKTGDDLDELPVNDPDYLESIFRPDLDKEDDKDIFLDLYLYQIAASLDKEIDGLEELKDQMTDYTTLSDEKVKNTVLELINYSDEEYVSQIEKMIEVYVSGDLNKIDAFIKSYSGYDAVLEKRNKVMVASITSIIEDKSLFAAIGAAHLPGETGVINLLRKEGYTVKKVENVFTGLSNNFVIKPNLDAWDSYTDVLHGYTLNLPASVQKIEIGEEDGKEAFVDLKSGTIFFHFGLDMRDKSKLLQERAPEKFVQNLVLKDSTAVLSNKEVVRENGVYKQIIIKGQSLNKVNHFELISKNGFFYVFGMEYSKSNHSVIAENFFKNVTFQIPTLENSLWQPFIHKEGAFSVDMPGDITDNSRTTPNPIDPDGDPYEINMYFAQDIGSGHNYIVRYNNFPLGYYLQNQTESAGELVSQVEQSTGAKVLSNNISTHNGYTTYDFEVKLQGKYHSIIRYFFRDSRTYILLSQSVNEIDTVSFDNPVFNSFKFEEYQPSDFKSVDDVDGKYSFIFPNELRSEIDTERQYDTYIADSKTYYGLDKNTGGCYSINLSDLKKYFRVNKDEIGTFFDEYADAYKEYGDSIYKKKSFLDEKYPAKEYYMRSDDTPVLKRHKFILMNNRLVVLSSYLGEEETESQKATRFFNGVTMKKQKAFDVYTSKASLIMKDIKSSDSITRFEANGALDYYDFETSDRTILEKGLTRKYINDTTYYGTKNLLIYNLGLIGNTSTISKLESFYNSDAAKEYNKSMTLVALTKMKLSEANEVYFRLIETNPPIREVDGEYPILDAEADSILSYKKYGDRILKLNDTPEFRDLVISYWVRTIRKDSTAIEFLKERKDQLFKHFEEDVMLYTNTSSKILPIYLSYEGIINDYINLYSSLNIDTKETKEVIENLFHHVDKRNWYTYRLYDYYITNTDMPNQAVASSLLEELYYRFEAMQVILKSGKEELIPMEYLEPSSFAKLSLYNAIGDYHGYSDEITYNKTIPYKGEEYDIYTVSYTITPDEGEVYTSNYLGVVKKGVIDVTDFNLLEAHYSYEVMSEESLDNQAISLLDSIHKK
ncbi:TraB/GumN family protein [Dokdonia sp.]|uniref:TraB/GumN family protein n=1 Tax=Dokdonia sp. TaxID=2024995 RepID=UPI003263E656